jgi:hypothetical protein
MWISGLYSALSGMMQDEIDWFCIAVKISLGSYSGCYKCSNRQNGQDFSAEVVKSSLFRFWLSVYVN